MSPISVVTLACGHTAPFVNDRQLPTSWYCSTCRRTVAVVPREERTPWWDEPPSKGEIQTFFGRCECGHPIYDHTRRTVPNAGMQEYGACHASGCECGKFKASDGWTWPLGQEANNDERK